MSTKFFLVAGLLASAVGMGQNTQISSNGLGGGINEVHVGHDAGLNTTTGANNVFVGYEAGRTNQAGSRCVFIGKSAGNGNLTSNHNNNTYIGFESGQSIVGSGNVFTGSYAGQGILTGSTNSFYGHQAGRYSIGSGNCFFGNNSGMYVSQSGNVCIGSEAAAGNSTFKLGAGNVVIGQKAAELSTSSSSVILGQLSGYSSTGNNNVFIGNNAGYSSTGGNKLYIHNSDVAVTNPLIYGEFNTKRLKFNGIVGIGTDFGDFPTLTSTILPLGSYKLFVKGGILAEEVRIRTINTWPDYVFSPNYDLMTLKDVEIFIKENGHLPNVPSALEVENEGVELGNIVKIQQEKIEELTLHLIEQNKEIEELKVHVKQLLNKK